MDSFDDVSPYLDLPIKLLNVVRSSLAEVNVPLPMYAAQAILAVLASVVACYLVLVARKTWKASKFPLLPICGAIAMAALPLWIAIIWIDYARHPLRPQIVGSIMAAELQGAQIDLLDFKERSLNPTVDIDTLTKEFVVNYQPAFADPPVALVVTVPKCETRQVMLNCGPLRNNTVVQVNLTCGE